MVVEELLRNTVDTVDSRQDLMDVLEEKTAESRANKLWLDNLIKTVLIVIMFVRAKHEGGWSFHLWTVK